MNKYELVYVIDTTLDDDARKAVMDRFHGMLESLGGKVEKVEEWGKRRLAYPINDLMEGYYVLMTFNAAAAIPATAGIGMAPKRRRLPCSTGAQVTEISSSGRGFTRRRLS